jgi:hypothetical protein
MKKSVFALAAACLVLVVCLSTPTLAADKITCHMNFQLHGWSVFYKTAKGQGEVSCSNGQSMPVKLKIKGGGITFGKSTVDHGHGKFTGVYDISEVLGSYGYGGAHAGATKSANATVLTKGPVSLAINGTGRGFDVGVDVGAFIISRSDSQ